MSDGWRGRLERRAARVLRRKTIPMRNERGVVSFTFDDVPATAFTTGRSILEEYDCLGTYYVSGGLTDQARDGDSGRFHTRDELRSVHEAGHELGCHGYAHLSYQEIGGSERVDDLDANRSFFEDLGCDLPPTNFAYPLGHASPAAKALVGRRYVSARGVQPGVQKGSVDLALLKATPLYAGSISEHEIAALIAEAERDRGWLIFITHGVVEDPDPWGATPELLEFAVRTAARSDCRTLSVAHALGHVAFRPGP